MSKNSCCDITRTRGPLKTHCWNEHKKLMPLSTLLFPWLNSLMDRPEICVFSKHSRAFKNEYANVELLAHLPSYQSGSPNFKTFGLKSQGKIVCHFVLVSNSPFIANICHQDAGMTLSIGVFPSSSLN